MAFVQIIEMRTSKVEEMQRVGEEWEAAVGDDRTARRRVFCQDRDNPDRYFNIVFFDSYESAMQNSEHPTTQKFSKRMGELVDGEPTFYNLDVLDERG
jgi:quinol monooxygenase YgiN